MTLKLPRCYTGLTLRKLGEKMEGADYAAVSIGLRRFEQRLKKDRKLKAIYKEIIKMLNVLDVTPEDPYHRNRLNCYALRACSEPFKLIQRKGRFDLLLRKLVPSRMILSSRPRPGIGPSILGRLDRTRKTVE